MELLYLLCSIVSTAVKSSLLSLLLAVRYLSLLLLPSAPNPDSSSEGGAIAVRLYEGRVWHSRRRPVPHAFEYPVRYALIDLDLAPQPSHRSADSARKVAGTDGPVLLLTIPASVGYEQNPLSVYYCFDNADARGQEQEQDQEEGEGPLGRLKTCIAEVTNTPWGEQVSFIFDPSSDLVAKPLHVSPFMDMLGNWSIHSDVPCEDIFLAISVQHPTLGNYFTATLRAKRVCSSSSSRNLCIYFWLMPHKVAIWIYWQAVQLWWKNVAFLQHPKYSNPNYKEDALIRDQELHCPYKTAPNLNHPNYTSNGGIRNRWCVWRDAKWPWS